MKVTVKYQDSYSRGELLLRSFFGWAYILIPHLFLMFFYLIWVYILMIYTFFSVLITTKYPRVAFDAYVGFLRWNHRVTASLTNLVDGYPPFGPSTRWEKADFEVGYPSVVTRKRYLFSIVFAAYAVIPHLILIYLRLLVVYIYQVIAWFAVLFTGKFPQSMHKFIVDTYRLSYRVSLYTSALYFKYPEFSGDETEMDRKHLSA